MSDEDPQLITYSDVDGTDVDEVLLRLMEATPKWPVVQELHAWSRAALLDNDVLDVGCGLGDVLIGLAQEQPARRHVGVDPSGDMLAAARGRAAAAGVEVEFQEASGYDLPFADDEFGAARSERVMQWLDDPVGAIREMARVTRPGGSVVVIDTDWRTRTTNVTDDALERRVNEGSMAAWPNPGAGSFLLSWAEEAGLVDIDLKPVVHTLRDWPDDGSAGLPPLWLLQQNFVAAGVDEADATAWTSAVRALADSGGLVGYLVLAGVRGRVPG